MTTAAGLTLDVTEPGLIPDASTNERAMEIVKKWSLWAMAPGILPFGLFIDLSAIAVLQMKMVQEMSELYGVKFSDHRVRNILFSLVGGFGSGVLAQGVVLSVVKAIPFVGQAAGVVALPISAGACTWAIGKVFAHHFATGGTLLNFDAERFRGMFNRFYKEKVSETTKAAQDAKEAAM